MKIKNIFAHFWFSLHVLTFKLEKEYTKYWFVLSKNVLCPKILQSIKNIFPWQTCDPLRKNIFDIFFLCPIFHRTFCFHGPLNFFSKFKTECLATRCAISGKIKLWNNVFIRAPTHTYTQTNTHMSHRCNRQNISPSPNVWTDIWACSVEIDL